MVVWRPLEAERLFQSLVHAACVACALNMRALTNESILNATDSTTAEGHSRQGDMNSLSASFNSTKEKSNSASTTKWFTGSANTRVGFDYVLRSGTSSGDDLNTICDPSASDAHITGVGHCASSNCPRSNLGSVTGIGLDVSYHHHNNSFALESRLVPVAGSLAFGKYSRHDPHVDDHEVESDEPAFGLLTPDMRDQHSGPESLYSEEMNRNIFSKDYNEEVKWNTSKRQKTAFLSDEISESVTESLIDGKCDLNETVVDKEDLNTTLISLALDHPIENEGPDILTSAQVTFKREISHLQRTSVSLQMSFTLFLLEFVLYFSGSSRIFFKGVPISNMFCKLKLYYLYT